MSSIPREQIGPVLGRIPSGVFILTAADESGRETGMLASWVQQASFEPPMVVVAVNRKRYVNSYLQATSQVALCLVGESQKNLLSHFGKGFDPDQNAFEGLNVGRTEENLPVLADALGYLAGRIEREIEAGDHLVYTVAITSAGAGANLETESPMVHIRKNGFNY